MSEFTLKSNGKEYGGWKGLQVTRSLEAIAHGFSFEFNDRWKGQDVRWPISEGDAVEIYYGDTLVITGYVDSRTVELSADNRSMSVAGRSKAGDLVDSSAVLSSWEFLNVRADKIISTLIAPFGLKVSTQNVTLPAPRQRFAVNPGDSVFEVIDRLCRLSKLLPVSDASGNIILTQAGKTRAVTELVEGENIKSLSASFSYSDRFYKYTASGQHPDTHGFLGAENAAGVQGSAYDKNIRQTRVLMIRAEGTATAQDAKDRAVWESVSRSGKGGQFTVTVPGWEQGDGTLWPVNSLVRLRSPSAGINADLLITQATHVYDETNGKITNLALKRKEALAQEPLPPEPDPWELTDDND